MKRPENAKTKKKQKKNNKQTKKKHGADFEKVLTY